MPAVNPSRLAGEVEDLVSSIDDPNELCRKTLALLDFYADRTRRPSASTTSEDTPWRFGSPRPVLRSVSQALQNQTSGRPDLAFPAAEALWSTGYRETQVLAAGLLSRLTEQEVPLVVERMAKRGTDGVARAALAGDGLAAWRSANREAFLPQVSDWLASPDPRLRMTGLWALNAAVGDRGFEEVPAVFRSLEGRLQDARGESRQVLCTLVESLAQRSPQEAAAFLLGERKRDRQSTERVIRSTLRAFPSRQQELLRSALST